jgi:hypothetical protein
MIATPGLFRKCSPATGAMPDQEGGQDRAIVAPRLGCFPEAPRDFLPGKPGISPMAESLPSL